MLASSRKPRTGTPPRQPAPYWPRAVWASRSSGSTTEESTFFLQPHRPRLEVGGLVHRGKRHELQQVVLDDVAGRTDAVVVAGAGTDADVLGHGDLHMVDVVRVPQRLEHRVGESQRQQVLHRFLAEVVVDPEDGAGGEDLAEDVVEFLGAGQVVPERLLHHNPPPGALRALGQAAALELLGDGREELRRDAQVKAWLPPVPRAVSSSCSVVASWAKAASSENSPRRTGCPCSAAPRRPRRTGCAHARAPRRAPPWRSPDRPSRGARSRRVRTTAAAARGWRGRRWPASACAC